MIFTKLARILAIVNFVSGLSNVLLGLATATELIGSYEAALARYTNMPFWQRIDRANCTIFAAAELRWPSGERQTLQEAQVGRTSPSRWMRA